MNVSCLILQKSHHVNLLATTSCEDKCTLSDDEVKNLKECLGKDGLEYSPHRGIDNLR